MRNSRKNRAGRIALAAGLALAVAAGCSKPAADPWPAKPGKRVLVSFAPLYSFTTAVAGDDANVVALMNEVGPHHYDATERDALLVSRADLFLINGLGLEDELARKLVSGTGNKAVKLVALGESIPADMRLKGECHHHGDGEHNHHHGDDPHVWLGVPQAIICVEKIRDELKAIDPERAAGYDTRAAEYVAKLRKLHADGTAMLKGKTERKIVTFHESLNYFAQTYGLDVVGVIEEIAGSEPNAEELKEIVEQCKDNKVRVIAVEPQYPHTTSARVILNELKRQGVADPAFVEIDPLETAPGNELSADLYEKRMRANLENLAKALK
jgi:ABC-type Zn uptake system ZnuABC Zn-binding protein ZnuA